MLLSSLFVSFIGQNSPDRIALLRISVKTNSKTSDWGISYSIFYKPSGSLIAAVMIEMAFLSLVLMICSARFL